MKVCVYDNPDTMARECWRDGEIILQYSSSFLLQRVQPKINFIANIGDWKVGQMIGTKEAIKKTNIRNT
jgi:hypothetical protein